MPTCAGCSQEIDLSAAYCPRCGTPNPDAKTLPTPTSGETTEQVPVDELRMKLQTALGADFHVEGLLGEGGFALVFLVQDRKLSRRIAVKVLRPELTASRSSMRRFVREAEAAAGLNHPYILPIFFVGEGRGLVYFGMPLVEGETLEALMTREGQLPEAEVVRIGSGVAEALGDAHAKGLIHRDVKPANILLQGENRRPLVADFGIAKAAASKGDKLTGTGVVIGTPHYMSPEQAGGSGEVDLRSDIYSLGIVLWQMLAGALPFDGPDSQSILVQHITKPLPPLKAKRPGVSAGLAKVVARCTAKKPEERYQTAAEVAIELRECLAAPAVGPRRWPLMAGIALALLAVGVAAVLVSRRTGRSTLPAGEAPPAPDTSRSMSPVVAVLPFSVSAVSAGDTVQSSWLSAQQLAESVHKSFAVPVVDWNQLLGRWSAERRSLAPQLLDSNVAFAYRQGANQVVVGSYAEAGNQIRLTIDVYDAVRHEHLRHGNQVTGPRDSLFSLLDQLAGEVGQALCRQPAFNPRNLCFERAPSTSEPLRVVFAPPRGRSSPVRVGFYVLVGHDGTVQQDGIREREAAPYPELGRLAYSVVKAAHYTAASKGGAPVEAWGAFDVAVSPDTGQAIAVASNCANPSVGVQNPSGACFDTRPTPRAAPVIAVPPACRGAPGAAIVLVKVSAQGDVETASIRTGSKCPQFDDVALASMLDNKFLPAQKKGRAVPAWVMIPVTPLVGRPR